MHSGLFFLKKSINEKNTVSKMGEKINRPKPGANNNPNDEVRTCITLDSNINDFNGVIKTLIVGFERSFAVAATVNFVSDGRNLKRSTKEIKK